MQQLLKLTVLLLLLSGCNTYKTKYPYSLDDFRPELRGHLADCVEIGIANAELSSASLSNAEQFNKNCSVTDLKKLLKCEHPLLRALAFNLLINKDDTNIESTLFSLLNDTAIIAVNHGEFGIQNMYCADYYLEETRKETKISREKVFDSLIFFHPNLQNTFYEISGIDSLPQKYYTAIKQLAIIIIANQKDDNGASYLTYDDEKPSDILYALSGYKKKEDVTFIKSNLRPYHSLFWKTIKNDPDTSYFSFLTEYFERLVKSKKYGSEFLQSVFKNLRYSSSSFENILITLAKYKNHKSAMMLTKIITQKLYPINEYLKPKSFECAVYDIIVASNCDAYKTLIATLKPFAKLYKSQNNISFEVSTIGYDYPRQFVAREYW